MRVLILGVTGMLGSAVHRVFATDARHETWGTLRSASGRRHFMNLSLVTKQTHGALKANETKGLHRNIGHQLPYGAAE